MERSRRRYTPKILITMSFSSVQFSRSVVSDSLRPHESQHTRPPCPSPTPGVHSNSCIKSVMPSSHLILYRPLLLLPPIPPRIRVFSNESTLHMRWLKYWSFSFSIIPSKEIPGLISFRMDWLDLLVNATDNNLNWCSTKILSISSFIDLKSERLVLVIYCLLWVKYHGILRGYQMCMYMCVSLSVMFDS